MHGDEQKYKRLLGIISKHFEIVRLMDGEGKERRCFLRHDVDVDFAVSLEMAKIEKSMQICSTYYMLHTTSYYEKDCFLEECNRIQDMGHEIGFHNDIVEACVFNSEGSYKDILERELKFLKEGGLRIYGTSSHGSGKNFVNYQIFKECQRPHLLGHLEGAPPLYTLSLKDYGLYEVNFLPVRQDCFVTDSRGKWRCLDIGQDEWSPQFLQKEIIEDIERFIEELAARDDVKNFQLLTHPCHWRI